jgi:hypothetical protein
MSEMNLLWITVTLALGLITVLSAQIGMLQRRLRALENSPEPEPATFNTCRHGYVRPCPICDIERGGVITTTFVDSAP